MARIRHNDDAHVKARIYMRAWRATHPRNDEQRRRNTELMRWYRKISSITTNRVAANEVSKRWKMRNTEAIRAAGRQYYKENREKMLAKNKAWRAANRETHLLCLSRTRARNLNLPHSITEDDLVIPEFCPLLGIAIDYHDKAHCASVDRIDNSKGYVPGNVRVISYRANTLKANATMEELRALAVNLASYVFGQFGDVV